MKQLLLLIILITALWATNRVHIAVAANMGYVMPKLIATFKASYQSKAHLSYTIASSGQLSAQILQQAPYHVFISADMHYPQTIYDKGLSATEVKSYAKGAIVLLSRHAHLLPLLTTVKDFSFLIQPAIKHIAMANPKLSPYGQASLQAIDNSTTKEIAQIMAKAIYANTIAQTLNYALLSADVAFVAKSALYMPTLRQRVYHLSIDETLYAPIQQGIILLKRAINNEQAKAFYHFMLSKRAKQVLARVGYSF